MVGADSVPKKLGSNNRICLSFYGYQYYSSPVCLIPSKNLTYLQIIQKINYPLYGYYHDKFGNATPTTFLSINTQGNYEINLNNMPSNTVCLMIYYSGNPYESILVNFDVIVEYTC